MAQEVKHLPSKCVVMGSNPGPSIIIIINNNKFSHKSLVLLGAGGSHL
jgi:hypothetical protein